jgi:hypothetical protein
MTPCRTNGRQHGMVMVIALIMLLAVTLMVVSASNLVQANLQAVQNTESREMARSAALSAIEEALSSPRFAQNPSAMFLVGCKNPNQRCYDINGDGTDDIEVQMNTPSCISYIPLKNSELNVFVDPLDATCHSGGTNQESYSWCGSAVWELVATATDVLTGASVTVRQGVSIKTKRNDYLTACP